MKRNLLTFLMSLLAVVAAQAQTLQGTVVDTRTREPIAGANVLVKDEKGTGVVTDINGEFKLPLKKVPSTVVITYIGYHTSEVKVYDVDEPLVLEVSENNNVLDGVVVVGYGTQQRKALTGSVATVKLNNETNPVASSFDGLLNGRTAGVQVTATSNQPGGGVSIRVRGGSSVQGGNEPLYVIDGFPIYNSSTSAGAVSGTVTNPLAALNPNDIESVNVLKDASATAIYGSRGANGVVIITTKQGKVAERAKITYEASIGWQSLRKKIDLLNATEFAKLRNEALYDTNPALGEYQYLSADEVAALGEGTDWQDEAYRTGFVQNHNLSITGGTQKTRYAVSANWYDQEGIILNTDFQRLSARVNLDSELTKYVKVGVNLTISRNTANVAPSGIVSSLLLMPPTATIYEADGSYTLRNPFENIFSNPIASLREQTNKTKNLRILGTGFGEWKLADGLKLKILAGADVTSGDEYNYVPSYIYEGKANNGSATRGTVNKESWLNENTLTYTRDFNRTHHFDALLGFTQQESKVETLKTGSSDYVSDHTKYNSLASGAVVATPSSSASKNALISFLGRVNYSFRDRYFLTAALRRDGSSRFGENNKWGTFPSAGISWQADEEAFYAPLKSLINTLKVRVSYGKTGNQEIGNYQSLSTMSSATYLIGGQKVIGFTPNRISNYDLGWETTHQFDAGLDFNFFERVDFSVDAYVKKTTDLLLDVEIPYTTGFSTSLQNYGSVKNTGWEFTITSHNFVKKNFTWDTDFNISFNRNEVLSLGNGADEYIQSNYIIKVGRPLGTFYGLVADGVLQTGEETEKAPYTVAPASAKAGDRLYKDINGDGGFSTTDDRAIIGNAQPDFIFGLNNSFRYRNWDLSFFIQGVVGNDILNSNELSLQILNGQQNASAKALDRWTPTNPSTTVSRAKVDPATYVSDLYIEDGSFVRLKSINIGYTLPKRVLRNLHISNLRVFANASNLLTFTDYTGYDPEVTSANNTTSPGNDSGIYPASKSYNLGVSIDF
ncbi:MAG: TonB-dependent receptor [Bacteroidales bacterium]|nr:TonB-dependent receptor [Bacteroidales bacterium]